MMRDIQRAQRNAPQMAAVNERRFNIEQKVQAMADALLPQTLRTLEKILALIEAQMTVTTTAIDMQARATDAMLAIAQRIPGIEALQIQGVNDIASIRNFIREWLDRDGGREVNFDQFQSLALPVGVTNIAPLPPPPGAVVGMP
jgi:hypothetical protein